jgi:TonB family protein
MRLGEQGVTTLDIQVNGSGDCVSAAVIRSSGSDRLDMAAAEFVKLRWKWEPMPELGGQLKGSTISIAWSLKDAQ